MRDTLINKSLENTCIVIGLGRGKRYKGSTLNHWTESWSTLTYYITENKAQRNSMTTKHLFSHLGFLNFHYSFIQEKFFFVFKIHRPFWFQLGCRFFGYSDFIFCYSRVTYKGWCYINLQIKVGFYIHVSTVNVKTVHVSKTADAFDVDKK